MPKPRANLSVTLPAPPGSPTFAAVEKVTQVEGITEYRLGNGLRVLLYPDASKPIVTVNVTYLVGSRHEGYGESGMAHLLEHMLFKGTKARPDIMRLLQEKGGNFNGTTWFDRTNYYETLPADPGNLEFALALEADRMVGSRIDAADLAKEFSVVRNEFEIGESDPMRVLEEKMMSVAFQWHNYGKSTIGSRSDIERVPIENLREFYRKFYQPDNAILIVTGRFDRDEALGLIQRYFGPLPKPDRVLPTTWTQEPVQDGERVVTLRRTGDVPVVAVLYHTPAMGDPQWLPTDALVDILTRKPSGRLYKALVGKGLATEVGGALYPTAEPGVLIINAQVAPKVNPDKVRKAMLPIIEGIGKDGVTDVELERWRAGRLKGWELALTDSAHVGVELSEWAAAGDWRLLFFTRDRAKTLGRDAVAEVARKYLKESNRTVGIFLPTANPDRAPLLTRPDLNAVMSGWKPQPDADAGEVFAATFDNIDARTERLRLPGGAQVALLPKKTKGGSVRMQIVLRFGAEADLRGKTAAARAIAPLLMRGTRKRSFEQIEDELDRLRAEIVPVEARAASAANVAAFEVMTKREHAFGVVALLGELLREPAFVSTEFDTFKRERANQLEARRQDPVDVGFLALMRALSPWPRGDVRHVPSITEALAELTALKVADVRALHRRLWGADAMQVAIVGDIDAAQMRQLVTETFGTWKASRPFVRIDRAFTPTAPKIETIDTPDKEVALVALGHSLQANLEGPDTAALFMVNQILGGGLNSRLWLRLRQSEGLSYGAGSDIQIPAMDTHAVFYAYAMCAPQNAAKAEKALREELLRFVTGGVTQAELDEARKGWLAEWQTRLADDGFVASELANLLYRDRTMAFWKDIADKVAQLTPQDVSAVARKLLRPQDVAVIKAGDQSKASPSAATKLKSKPSARLRS